MIYSEETEEYRDYHYCFLGKRSGAYFFSQEEEILADADTTLHIYEQKGVSQ